VSRVEEGHPHDSSGPTPVVKWRPAGTVRYQVRDVFGQLIGTHVRKQPRVGQKRIWWEPALNGRSLESMPLYGSELVRAWDPKKAIVIVEGEAAAQAMIDAGFYALGTVTGAATTPNLLALTPCVGRDIVLWPDNDGPGRAHMDRVARLLHGRAWSMAVLEWTDAPDHGDAVDFLANHNPDELEALLDASQPWKPTSSVQIVAATDLLAMEFSELQWAIEGILPEGAAVLAAAPKIGKSWLVDDWAVAIAEGSRAMGAIEVDAGQVLLLPLEDSPRRMLSRVKAILRGRPLPADRLDIAFNWPRIGEGFEDQVEAWIAAHQHARLVVVDTLAKVRPRQRFNRQLYEVDYEDLSTLASVVKSRPGVALVAVHHDRKAEADDFLDTVSGSHGITGAADTVLVLRRSRGSADAVLHVTGRDVEEDDHALRFTGGLWELTGDPIADGSDERNAIALWLAENGPAGPSEVARALDRPPGATRMLMSEMLKDGQLVGGGQDYHVPFRVRHVRQ
jgi:hypothetical protein